MSSSPSPFARAQRAMKPILKPKSPLRRQSVNIPNSPTSPSLTTTTMFNKSPSTASSLSGHGTLSTSTSASSEMDKQQSSQSLHTIKLGDIEISLPLLATTGVSVFVAGLLFRAIYTFSTSILRLFVLIIVVWAFLTFSQLNDRQKERQKVKNQMEERIQGTGEFKLNPADFQTFGSAATQSTTTNGNSGGGVGYASGYGHSRYPTTNSPLQSPSLFTSDGRTRNLLSPHQRFANYST